MTPPRGALSQPLPPTGRRFGAGAGFFGAGFFGAGFFGAGFFGAGFFGA
ncbi:hypothetical protein [Streptomyces sp. NPDC048710]